MLESFRITVEKSVLTCFDSLRCPYEKSHPSRRSKFFEGRIRLIYSKQLRVLKRLFPVTVQNQIIQSRKQMPLEQRSHHRHSLFLQLSDYCMRLKIRTITRAYWANLSLLTRST